MALDENLDLEERAICVSLFAFTLFCREEALAEEARLLKDDLKTIERIARERYGMVKENESVYMLYPHPPEKTR